MGRSRLGELCPGSCPDWTTSYGVAYTWPNNTAWWAIPTITGRWKHSKTLEIGEQVGIRLHQPSEGGFAVYVDGVQVGKVTATGNRRDSRRRRPGWYPG